MQRSTPSVPVPTVTDVSSVPTSTVQNTSSGFDWKVIVGATAAVVVGGAALYYLSTRKVKKTDRKGGKPNGNNKKSTGKNRRISPAEAKVTLERVQAMGPEEITHEINRARASNDIPSLVNLYYIVAVICSQTAIMDIQNTGQIDVEALQNALQLYSQALECAKQCHSEMEGIVQVQLASLLHDIQAFDKALENFEQGLDIFIENPDKFQAGSSDIIAQYVQLLVNCYTFMGEFQRGVEFLTSWVGKLEALSADYGDSFNGLIFHGYLSIVECHHSLKDYEKSLECLEKAKAIPFEIPMEILRVFRYLLGITYANLQRYIECVPYLEQFVTAIKSGTRQEVTAEAASCAEAKVHLAQAYYYLNEHERSEKAIEEALELLESCDPALFGEAVVNQYFSLGTFCVKIGQLEKGVKILELAYASVKLVEDAMKQMGNEGEGMMKIPDARLPSSEVAYALGSGFLALKEREKAVTCLLSSVEKYKGKEHLVLDRYLLICRCYVEMGMKKKAVDLLEKVVITAEKKMGSGQISQKIAKNTAKGLLAVNLINAIGNTQKAKSILDSIDWSSTNIQEDQEKIAHLMSELELAKCCFILNNFSEGNNLLSKFLKQGKDEIAPDTRMNVGEVLFLAGQFVESFDWLSVIFSDGVDGSGLTVRLLILCLYFGHIQLAQQALDKYSSKVEKEKSSTFNNSFYFANGLVNLANGKIKIASTYFEKAENNMEKHLYGVSSVNSFSILLNLGFTYLLSGEYYKSGEIVKRIKRVLDDNDHVKSNLRTLLDVRTNLSELFLRLGKFSEARDEANAVISLGSDFGDKRFYFKSSLLLLVCNSLLGKNSDVESVRKITDDLLSDAKLSGERRREAEFYLWIGIVEFVEGWDKSVGYLENSLEAFKDLSDVTQILFVRKVLSWVKNSTEDEDLVVSEAKEMGNEWLAILKRFKKNPVESQEIKDVSVDEEKKDTVEDVKEIVEDTKEVVAEKVEELKEVVQEVVEDTKDVVEEKVEALKEVVEDTKDVVEEKVEEKVEVLKEVVEEIVEETKKAVAEVVEDEKNETVEEPKDETPVATATDENVEQPAEPAVQQEEPSTEETVNTTTEQPKDDETS